MKKIVEVTNLNKSYGDKRVLTDVTFSLQEGEIMGLVGENGSGKTTIFKAILGLIKLDSATIKITDVIVDGMNKEYLNQIGAIVEYPTFYEHLSAFQNIDLTSNLYRTNISKEMVMEALGKVGLAEVADKKVSSFSLGMKQRLGIARALIHSPKLLLLDEPFNGLDPRGVKDLRQLLLHLSSLGTAMIVSSHSLEELRKVVDTIAIIHQGKLIFYGDKSEYLEKGKSHSEWLLATDDLEKTRTVLDNLGIKFKTSNEEFVLHLPVEKSKNLRALLSKNLSQQGISLLKIAEKEESFEDIFLSISDNEENAR